MSAPDAAPPHAAPGLLTLPARGRPRAVVLLAHGGAEVDLVRPRRLGGPALRMYPFLLDLHRAGRGAVAVAQLRYRAVGWNGGVARDDVRWAAAELGRRHGGAPVCLVGHSMGGRACLAAAAEPGVVAVAALAPWLPRDEPAAPAAGRTVLVAHGLRDTVTAPAGSLRWAWEAHPLAARLCRFEVARSGHAMLERAPVWHALVRRFVLGVLGLAPLDDRLAVAFAAPPARAVRMRI